MTAGWSFEPSFVRGAFASAADAFATAVAAVPHELWDAPGLGEWTVRELVGHTGRALTTVTFYLQEEPAEGTEVLEGPTDYFTRLAPLVDHAQIAERGRRAAQSLGDDPAGAVAKLVTDTLDAVEAADDGAVVVTPGGAMRLIDYLPSRVYELTVHRLDLEAATGIEPQHDEAATELSLLFSVALAARGEGAEAVLWSLTGRRPLPDGYSVF